MIIRPFNAPEPSDARLHAGWEAEKETAHYLDRQFGPFADIRLFHGLRFPTHLDDDAAQIDHLILYRHGIAIIETKSVSGTLHVDGHKQWVRRWRSRSGRSGESNIPSPVLQAERQATALRRLLGSARPPLMDKMAGLLQKSFRAFPIVPYIGISVGGRFEGETAPFDGRVMKADEVADAVIAQIDKHRKGSGLRGLLLAKPEDCTVFTLNDGELDRITAYLSGQHTDRGRAASPSPPVATATKPPPEPSEDNSAVLAPSRLQKRDRLICTKCGEERRIEVVYRRDYCLLCHACQGYTALGRACGFCAKAATIRKDGPEFYRDCRKENGGCGKQVVFWVAQAAR